MTLVAKVGMDLERDTVLRYIAPGTLVLPGVAMDAKMLNALVPRTCTALIRLGLCGGLSAAPLVGQAFVYRSVRSPSEVYLCDTAWRRRLFAATHYVEADCWSSGEQNTANTPAQRLALYQETRCAIIDDESLGMAQLASERGIPFAGVGVISDAEANLLPPAVLNALNPNGSTNYLEVLESVWEDPDQVPSLVQTALNAKRSYDELDTACIAIGRNCQWQEHA